MDIDERHDEDQDYCPRCIEDWDDEEGNAMKGLKVPSDCEVCGICTECEHLYGCKERDDYEDTPEEDRI